MTQICKQSTAYYSKCSEKNLKLECGKKSRINKCKSIKTQTNNTEIVFKHLVVKSLYNN